MPFRHDWVCWVLCVCTPNQPAASKSLLLLLDFQCTHTCEGGGVHYECWWYSLSNCSWKKEERHSCRAKTQTGRPFSSNRFNRLFVDQLGHFSLSELPGGWLCLLCGIKDLSDVIRKQVILLYGYVVTQLVFNPYHLDFFEQFVNGPLVVLELGR